MLSETILGKDLILALKKHSESDADIRVRTGLIYPSDIDSGSSSPKECVQYEVAKVFLQLASEIIDESNMGYANGKSNFLSGHQSQSEHVAIQA